MHLHATCNISSTSSDRCASEGTKKRHEPIAHALLRAKAFTYCREKEFLKLVNRHPRANNYAPISRAGRVCQLCLREIIANSREIAIDHCDLFVVNQTINRIARYLTFAEDEHHFGLRDDAPANRAYSPQSGFECAQ